MSTSADAVDFYDSLWTRTTRVDQHHKCRMHAIKRALQGVPVPATGRRKILELGCGSGIVSAFLAGYGDVTGIDQSPIGVETARRRTTGRFMVGVLPDIQLDEHDFDLCVATQVLEHLTDTDQVALLENAHGVVREGGYLLLTTPNKPVAERIQLRPGEPEPIENWLTPSDLHALLARTGWTPVETRFAFSFLPVLASRHQWLRPVRYLAYDVLRLRNVFEDIASPFMVGDCTVILASR